MIKPKEFYDALIERGVDFFTGVPDSLLKDFGAYVMDNAPSDRHIITANEGSAVARTIGHHIGTGKIGLVYMQNSGQGNAVNPLVSSADKDVYSIPMILLIGWRGEPGKKDEPQHVKQGKITLGLLDTLGIEKLVLSDNIEDARKEIDTAVDYAREHNEPYGIVVKADTFEEYKLQKGGKTNYELDRESALKIVVGEISDRDIVVSTTGKTSRELFELREGLGEGHGRDFLCVGNMGHASSIADEVAGSRRDRNVYCFDGDGALIMHMGALTDVGKKGNKNFKHIVFNNGSHDSVGGQPTAGFDIDILGIAKACGYKEAWRAETAEEIKERMKALQETEGPSLLEIRVNKGARKDLGRPTTSPIENKHSFMEFLSE
ncbi:phosphonopyruvate decarboxylase [Candidatus Pacearchaeota archaeon]|nr:phosphonopyruvate decarboxylase [Candidatus Pacearchaeota archaeon]|tara:strand:+ start:15333 stop:16460 length:1128 start_codon:yes stop_codon:yes gene_type:complete